MMSVLGAILVVCALASPAAGCDLETFRERLGARSEAASGVVSHVSVMRDLPFSKDVELRVYVSGTRRSGSVIFAPNGTVKRVFE